MNGYKAFYKGKSIEVQADTPFKAQQLAAIQFKAKKPYEVTIMACKVDNKTVIHSTTNL